MRSAGLIILIVAGVAALAGGAFLIYLNWAFTPRGPSQGHPAFSLKVRASGTLGEGRHYSILETRTEGGADTIYTVNVAADPATAAGGDGATVLRVTNKPVPLAVRPTGPGEIEVEFGAALQPTGARTIAIRLSEVEQTGWIAIRNGAIE
jgi:hypothetical protein